MYYAFSGAYLIVLLLIFAVMVVVWYHIFSKAGYSGALAVLMLVPLINVVTAIWFALSRWPVLEELQRLRGGAPRA